MARNQTTSCPKLLTTLVISDNSVLAAQISSALAQKRSYLAVVDEPRIHRPDANNEFIRRHNVAARVKAKHIIFANVDDQIVESINLPPKRIIRIKELSDLFGHKSSLTLREEIYFDWGMKNIAVGLLLALRAGKILRLVPDGPDGTEVPTESGHLVICEEGEELATIQAANYAYSLGAGLKIMPTTSEQEAEAFNERLYSINAETEYETLSPSQKLEALTAEMRQHVGGELPANTESVTFVTFKVPWGFAYPEKPATHLFAYPDLGIHLANAFAAEQQGSSGIRVATIIEPGQVNAREVDVVVQSLCQRNVIVREYRGESATVRTVSKAVELFPYDLLFISSHCGDAPGWRWTYHFKDSAGKDRELVTDVAASFAPKPGEDLIHVTVLHSFVALDGVSWHDPEKDKKLEVGTAIKDWMELTNEPSELDPTTKINIPRVHGSSAIKLHDHHLLIMPSHIASHNTPIIINNACTSWHRLAGTFHFMNARAYIGTLFEVGDTEAYEIVRLMFTKYYGRSLSVALWHSQNSLYGKSVRRPYVMSGPHFQRFDSVPGSKVNHLGRFLTNLCNEQIAALKSGRVPEKHVKDYEERIDFFKYELETLRTGRTDYRNRPSSERSTDDENRLILD